MTDVIKVSVIKEVVKVNVLDKPRVTVKTIGIQGAAGPVSASVDSGWSDPINSNEVKSLDADSTTINEISDVLGTLIGSLKSIGVLSD